MKLPHTVPLQFRSINHAPTRTGENGQVVQALVKEWLEEKKDTLQQLTAGEDMIIQIEDPPNPVGEQEVRMTFKKNDFADIPMLHPRYVYLLSFPINAVIQQYQQGQLSKEAMFDGFTRLLKIALGKES